MRPQPVHRFGTFTVDLDALAGWLWACAITTVGLEATGVYWIPLFEVLEARGFQVLLVYPGQMPRNGLAWDKGAGLLLLALPCCVPTTTSSPRSP